MTKSALVIGASRGLGLGLVKELKARGWSVTATERGHSDALHAAGVTVISAIDVADTATLHHLAHAAPGPFDLLFVVAGIWGPQHQDPARATPEEVAVLYLSNSTGPIAAAAILSGNVTPGGTIALMSSGLGSIARNGMGGSTLYRGSKAALNAMAVSFALSDAGRSRTVRVVDPGWVQTDMGGPAAPLTIDISVPGMVTMLEREAGKGGIRYLNYQGEELPW